jgi:hypothetical protein
VRRPSLSVVGAGVDFVHVFLGASHCVIAGGLWLMIREGRAAAGVTRVVIIDVAAICVQQ